jgi:menaquinone-dependent protoporphyrinogen IX oxidase
VKCMVKVFVVYDTKHGNTKLVAENIVSGLREVKSIDVTISDVDKVDIDGVADFDAILIGAPNHFGRPSRKITKFIDKLGKLGLEEKQVAVFDTYLGKDFEKAVKKMEGRINDKTSLQIITLGLSIRVEDMKGPVIEGELHKSKEFGKKIAIQLMK